MIRTRERERAERQGVHSESSGLKGQREQNTESNMPNIENTKKILDFLERLEGFNNSHWIFYESFGSGVPSGMNDKSDRIVILNRIKKETEDLLSELLVAKKEIEHSSDAESAAIINTFVSVVENYGDLFTFYKKNLLKNNLTNYLNSEGSKEKKEESNKREILIYFLNQSRIMVYKLVEETQANLESEVSSLRDEVKQRNKELTDLTQKKEQLIAENISLQEKAKNSEEASAAILLSSSLLSNQKQELESKISNLETEKQTIKQRISAYEQEIQELLKNKAHLEIENEKLVKNNNELKLQLNQQKDKISKLEGDANLITNQLNDLEEELEITSTEEETPENKTLSKKISFFENWWKKTRQEKEEIAKSLEKEQGQIQTLRQSLTDLEEQLKNTGDDNLQQMHRLDQENKSLKKKLADHEINLGGERRKVENLEQDIADWKSQAQKLGLNLTNCQKQIVNQQKENKILNYCLIGAIVVILLGAFYFVYRKFFKVG